MDWLRLASCHVLAAAWRASSGQISLLVDETTFKYDVLVDGIPWLSGGGVRLHCHGEAYASNPQSGLRLRLRAVRHVEGQDEKGPWTGLEARWRGRGTHGACGASTAIRQYHDSANAVALEFITRIDAFGADVMTGTNTCTYKPPAAAGPAASNCYNVSTGFPTFVLPGKDTGVGFFSWSGMLLGDSSRHEFPANWSSWSGGLAGGPLVLHSEDVSLVLGSSSNFKDVMLTRSELEVAAGVQGMIQQLPANYTVRFALIGCKCGVTESMFRYGAFLRKAFQSSKFSLAEDVLSRQIHYLSDGGSLMNYCALWPACEKSPGGCQPYSRILKELSSYHRSIGLEVGLYHLDPFWYFPNETCPGPAGIFARDWSPSPFHFPDGFEDVGSSLMLWLGAFTTDNVYRGKFRFQGKSVAAEDAHRFFKEIFGKMHSTGRFKALTLDRVPDIWLSAEQRCSRPGAQELYDDGLAEAAWQLGVPIRTDVQWPSDVLASVQYGAKTVARCTSDSDPDYRQANLYRELGGNSLLLRALGVRPMVDVLWTNGNQTIPYYGPTPCEPNVLHNLISAVLSTGPVGFGDLVGRSDAALLRRALRADGQVLKPCSAALRLDRAYERGSAGSGAGGGELWAAPSEAARHTDPRLDSVANSMMDLLSHKPKGWMILATNVNGSLPFGRPLSMSELWPPPAEDTQFLVAQLAAVGNGTFAKQKTPCSNGSLVDDCLFRWNRSSQLPVATGDTSKLPGCVTHNFALFSVVPLVHGWALLGDLRKVVPVSPQRFVEASYGNAMARGECQLRFRVIGQPGEVVPVSVALPSAVVQVVNVLVGSGDAAVCCRVRCEQDPSFIAFA